MANPIYVVQSSCGPGPWKPVDTTIARAMFAWAWAFTSTSVGSTSGGDYKLEFAIDNPFNYGGVAGQPEGGLAVSPSSLAPVAFLLTAMSSVATGVFSLSSTPITAWRLNQQSSGLTATVSFLQSGIVG
jgi:hypothetical protein